MSIRAEKITNTNQVNTTQKGSQNSDVKTSNANIEFKNNTSVDSEIINFIQALQTSLTNEEKISEIKKQYPVLTDEQIQEYISIANQLTENTSDVNKTKPATEVSDTDTEDTTTDVPPENNEEEASVVTEEEKTSPEWKNKTPVEKLNIYLDSYLTKNDKKYASLTTEEEKLEYRKQQFEKLGQIAEEDYSKFLNASTLEQNTIVSKFSEVLEALHSENISIDDFVNMDNNMQRHQLIEDAKTKKFVKDLKNLIPEEVRNSKEWQNKSPEEKLNVYLDEIFKKEDPEYNKLKTAEEKQAYISSKADKMLTKLFPGVEEKGKKSLKNIATECINLIENNKEIKAKDIKKLIAKENIKDLSEDARYTWNDAAVRIKKKGGKVNYKTIREEIKNDPNIDPKIKKEILETCDTLEKIDKTGRELCHFINYDKVAKDNGYKNVNELISKTVNKNTNPEELKRLAQNIKPEEFNHLVKHLKALGYNEQFIQELSKCRDVKFAVAVTKGDGAGAENELYHILKHGKRETALICTKVAMGMSQKARQEFETNGFNRVDEKYTRLIATGMNDVLSPKQIATDMKAISDSKQAAPAAIAMASESLIETAKDDTARVELSKNLSTIDNEYILEGLAAGSKYVESKSAKTQYNNYVTTAAQNYPPETQAKIKTAMATGQVSQETLSQTTPATTDKASSNSNTNTNSNATASYAPAKTNTTTTQGASQPAAKQQTGTQNATAQTVQAIANSSRRTSVSSENSQTSQTSDTSETTKSSKTTSMEKEETESIKRMQEETLLEVEREEAAQKAKETEEKIRQSISEYDAKKLVEQTVEDTLEQLDLDGNITKSEKEKIKQQLMNAGSITAIYEIVAQLGAKEIFLDRLINSSAYAINAFVDNISDQSIIEELYLKCSIDTIKKDLLNKLPQDRIHALMQSKKIDNLQDLDYKIIAEFINKNIGSMTYQDFKEYAKYLPGDVRERMEERFKQFRGIETAEQTAQNTQPENEQSFVIDEEEQQPQDTTLAKVNPPKKAKNPTIQQSPLMSNVISSDKDTVSVLEQPEQKDTTELAMNDTVLTPGSDAWREKYGRYDYQPTTAFTTAEGDYFNGYFGSNKVGMRTTVNKKFPHGIKFNA
ncbi:MAG: hypothetical protein ACI37Q_07140 [Candidatus Gastranaerophilaceae bacterium]